jgi:hypothetical protein
MSKAKSSVEYARDFGDQGDADTGLRGTSTGPAYDGVPPASYPVVRAAQKVAADQQLI